MQNVYYLTALTVSILGMLIIDYRLRLAFWFDSRKTAKTVLLSILFFVLWDVMGIASGIFFHGGSRYTLGLLLGPEMPIEELFFLFLLVYTSLITLRFMDKKWPRT